MDEGKIIEYIDQRKIILSCCIKDKVNKLQLLTLSNHEVSIPPKRVLIASSSSINLSKSREELIATLVAVDKQRTEYASKVVVEDLWELTYDEEEIFPFTYLAQLAFGKNITDDHVSAILRALFAEGTYFKLKDKFFVPNSPEKVNQITKTREAAKLREKEISEGAGFLKQIMHKKIPNDFPINDKFVDVLVQLAIYGKDAQNFKQGKEMFSRAGIKDTVRARELLIKLGVWKEDENLDLYRFKTKISFDKPALLDAYTIAKIEINTSDREDLRNLDVFTIDGALTKDFDDALSFEPHNEGYTLGIHITDINPYIQADGPLDIEALNRASTIYLPERQISMLPTDLSHDTLSLKKNADRQAISLFADFDKDMELVNYRFLPTIIRVAHQYTYDEVNSIYKDDPVFLRLYQLAMNLRKDREVNGALLIPLPEIDFQFSNNSGIDIKLIEQDTPSRIIVSESMILYNRLAAKFASEIGLPILYRSQEKPQERLATDEFSYIYYVFQQRRKLRPLLVDTSPLPHSGLGVDSYTNITSPLRRYVDMVVQRQLYAALLNKRPIYNEARLKEINMLTQQTLKDIFLIKKNRMRYWILKYLSRKINDTFRAIVFQKLGYKYLIILKDLIFIADIPAPDSQELRLGQEIDVIVKKANPLEDTLIFELAD
ncbi:MAG: RNB domain-containing ribonuclease [Deltaproteobacteria bacterium]|nr:RNB domain-containing ribonuclease [Deltaproteobacteria bacterium]